MLTADVFAKEYETGRHKTINFLLSRGIPEHMAEETAQAAWVRGWERKGQLRDAQKAVPWVNSIALNIGRNSCRREARLEGLEGERASIGAGVTSSIVAAVDIHRKLAQCSEKERVLLERRYFGEWEIGELARDGRCTARAIRLQLFRARRRLKSLLLPRGGGAGEPEEELEEEYLEAA